VGEATLGPSSASMLSDYFPRRKLARALSVYTGAQYLGAGFALVVGGLAIQIVSKMPPPVLPIVGEIAPWQTTFLVVGLFGSLVLLPFFFVREPRRLGVTGHVAAGQSVPFSEVLAFMKLNWRTFTAHFMAFTYIEPFLGETTREDWFSSVGRIRSIKALTFSAIPKSFCRTFSSSACTGYLHG